LQTPRDLTSLWQTEAAMTMVANQLMNLDEALNK